MRIGFTGTREGMTIDQLATFGNIVAEQVGDKNVWHDGDCVGADAQANLLIHKIRRMGTDFFLHGHPARGQNMERWRAHNEYDITHDPKPPLVRNRDIVDSVEFMIAAPKEYDEVLRGSGTWATIRYARGRKVPLVIIWPDGDFSKEGNSI